jgi:hypothetical protein
MRIVIAAALLAGGLAAGPATAQYYGPGYDRPPPSDYDRPRRYRDYEDRDEDDDDSDRPPPRRDRYERPERRAAGLCVTSRGSCPTNLPRNAPCGCEIPGFGFKRGAVQ